MHRPVCAIIGAGEGLGKALAARFAAGGMDIALISRSEQSLAAAAAAVKQASESADARFFRADALVPLTIESALAEVTREMGEIEVLIYNVRGRFAACAPLEMSYTELEDNYKLEVVGAFAAAKSVLPSMIDRSNGSVFFFKRHGRISRVEPVPTLCHRKIRPSWIESEPGQGLCERRDPYCALQAGLRSGCSHHARTLRKRI